MAQIEELPQTLGLSKRLQESGRLIETNNQALNQARLGKRPLVSLIVALTVARESYQQEAEILMEGLREKKLDKTLVGGICLFCQKDVSLVQIITAPIESGWNAIKPKR